MHTPSERKFEQKLRKAAKSIKRHANGRVCGDCRYKAGCYCGYEWDLPGYTLFIQRDDAVACFRWEHKPNGVKREKSRDTIR